MPYGYEKYRLSKGISPNTIRIETQLIRSLLAYVNHTYKKSVEPHEIRPIDIKNFLEKQRQEDDLKDGTINRKISTIKNWFDFMWKIDKIPYDFMPKFELPTKLDIRGGEIDVDYSYLLSKKYEILTSQKILLYGKMLFLLYIRGFRVRDIVEITIDQIVDNGDIITIILNKDNGYQQKAVFTDIEIPIILGCIERAIFRGTDYLLSSKVDNKYVPLQLGSFKDFLYSIKEELGTSFRSEQIRFAYVHYLYTYENKTVEELQEILGVSLKSISSTLKEALERVKQVDYNKNNKQFTS